MQDGHVQCMHGCNVGTCITGLNDVGGRAILANKPEADGLARCEVRATSVNDRGVDRRELVTTMAQQQKKVNTG